MNITIKDVPDSLHEKLKQTAESSGRSVNKLILFTLERALSPRPVDRGDLIQRIRERRNAMEEVMDQEFLSEAIRQGRQ